MGHQDNPPRLQLVGYSGGGTVAALVAARRSDIQWLTTVAGNLDHAKWTELHELTPLSQSLNPADFANDLRDIPQLHLLGENDDNITIEVLDSYRKALNGAEDLRFEVVPDYTHKCCWEEVWPGVVCNLTDPLTASSMPLCRNLEPD